MSSMLVNNMYKTVELFMENLLWGKVQANYLKLIESGEESYVRSIYKNVDTWMEYHCRLKKDYLNDPDYDDATLAIYNAFVKGRIDGTISGELIDEKHEAKVRKLKAEVEDLKNKYQQVKDDNIALANELTDRQNIIDSYEKGAGFKKDGKS